MGINEAKKERILKAYKDWLEKNTTKDEQECDFKTGPDSPTLGFIGGYLTRDAEIDAERVRLITAIDLAVIQMAQAERMFDQDMEFQESLAEIRETLKVLRGPV